MTKERSSPAKLFLIACIIFSVGILLGVAAYSFIIKSKPILFPQAQQQINAIEISSDGESILDTKTKEVIFTIEKLDAYSESIDYDYNSNIMYPVGCFTETALSNNGKRIVFSTGCLTGDVPEEWIGIFNIDHSDCPLGATCDGIPEFQFLIAGSGRNFAWSPDDKTITYEADLGLSGMTETRTIDSQTGEILETKSAVKSFWEDSKKIKMDTSGWKAYDNNKYGFSFNYPADWKITENSGNNFDDPRVIIAGPEILKALEDEKARNNGENYGISDPAYNILVYYYPSIEEETQNKNNKYGAKTLDELVEKNGMLVKIEKTVIDGAEAVEVLENGEGQYHVLFIEKDRHLYKVFFSDILLTDSILNISGKILSTFKFTEKDLSFSCGTSVVKDIDGNIYNTVQIGSQCWMKQNLKVTKNPQGKPIFKHCYNDDPKACDTDGGLYIWNTAMNNSTQESAQGICPDGWHIPKDSEWYTLEKGLATGNCDANRKGWGCESVATKLEVNGSSGFDANFAGYVHPVWRECLPDTSCKNYAYTMKGKEARFWSSTGTNGRIWIRSLDSVNSEIYRYFDIGFSYSVRCLKD